MTKELIKEFDRFSKYIEEENIKIYEELSNNPNIDAGELSVTYSFIRKKLSLKEFISFLKQND